LSRFNPTSAEVGTAVPSIATYAYVFYSRGNLGNPSKLCQNCVTNPWKGLKMRQKSYIMNGIKYFLFTRNVLKDERYSHVMHWNKAHESCIIQASYYNTVTVVYLFHKEEACTWSLHVPLFLILKIQEMSIWSLLPT
jgi:hypothetical protein